MRHSRLENVLDLIVLQVPEGAADHEDFQDVIVIGLDGAVSLEDIAHQMDRSISCDEVVDGIIAWQVELDGHVLWFTSAYVVYTELCQR